ncbi:MAG: hypothetical protein OEV27_12365 [Nitrospira sp.]|nr:hypothetical protein [Nitrospira sp.]MDH4251972.1 hypothetical protein [Nitrospira sp.]MDH4344426.1 hypothetical protein [Nitrospira sp.]MDH5337304.1 hypothetical protein [Nitrospira sp.]
MKLDVKACALACGLIWGFGLFVLTWWIIAFDGLTGEPTFIRPSKPSTPTAIAAIRTRASNRMSREPVSY